MQGDVNIVALSASIALAIGLSIFVMGAVSRWACSKMDGQDPAALRTQLRRARRLRGLMAISQGGGILAFVALYPRIDPGILFPASILVATSVVSLRHMFSRICRHIEKVQPEYQADRADKVHTVCQEAESE